MGTGTSPAQRRRWRRWRTPRSKGAVGLLLVGMLLLPGVAAAVEDGTEPAELTIADADISQHPTVRLTVNAPATGGVQEDVTGAFTVTENGEARDASAEALSTEDLAVVVVVDTSGSMGIEPMASARDAAIGFVDAMPPAVEIAVMEFASDVVLLSELTKDRQVTTAAIDGLIAGGNTALYDAVDAALDLLDEVEVTREAIVLLSDGEDTFSDTTLEDVIARIEVADVTLHAIEFLTAGAGEGTLTEEGEGAVAVGIEALGDLVEAADDGSLVSADDADTLTEVYQAIAASLTNRFEVTYTSEAMDEALVEVTYTLDGVTAVGSRTIALPASPVEPEPEPDPEPDPEPEVEEEPVAQQPLEPLQPAVWVRPWMVPAGIGVFVVGLLGTLLYLHGWRITDRFTEKY